MKKIFIIILIVISFLSLNYSANSKDTNENIDSYLSNFSSEQIYKLQTNAGNNFDDWFILSVLRSGYEIDNYLYKGLLRHYINDNYQLSGYLSKNLMTEFHRIIMLAVSVGLDPREIILDDSSYDLLFDGIFNTKTNEALEKQGINSFVFALIAMDSFCFKELDDDRYHSRKTLIKGILSYELEGGGFAFSKTNPDIDMTALAVQALSEYYNSLFVYNVYNKIQDKNIETTVKDVIDRALLIFSSLQKEDGDFESYGVSNVESTAQVLISLSSLGIDIETDDRFIKNGNNLYEGIIKYQNSDGTFRRNDKSNKISGYQAFMGLVAFDRFVNNMRSIYDLKPEMDLDLKNKINNLVIDIDKIENASKTELEQLLARYKLIPGSERNYIYNFHTLHNELIKNEIEVTIKEEYSDNVRINETLSEVNENDINTISKLSKTAKIDDYYEMVYYQEKIRNSNVDETLVLKLDMAIKSIKDEKNKIIHLNELISEYLLFEDEMLKAEIINLYNNLLKDSKKHIIDYEEVNPNNLFTSRNLVTLGLTITIISIISIFTFRIIKRKRNN